jgi:hypothetical protein
MYYAVIRMCNYVALNERIAGLTFLDMTGRLDFNRVSGLVE